MNNHTIFLVSQNLYEVIERRCLEATAHIKKKEKNPDGLREKRFTIDKTIIKLTDFTEETELKVYLFSIAVAYARELSHFFFFNSGLL